MTNKLSKEKDYVLYQQICDEIFGEGTVKIKPASSNNVIGTFKYIDDYSNFIQNFKKRLIRLRELYEHTTAYPDILEQVKQVADPKNWEGAYAELVAYDVMWNDFINKPIEINKTLPATESYAGEMGFKYTNEDGYIPDYMLYFDVKILADTVGVILKGIIDDAIKQSKQIVKCNILPEYPLDDDDNEYSCSRTKLFNELFDFLKSNNTMNKGKKHFRSKIIPNLSYIVNWGAGVNTAISEYDPYRHAEKTKHLIFKRYAKKIMKNDMFVLVLVNFPWYNHLISSFINANQVYYRSLARRTFCENYKKCTQLNTIVPKYNGNETVDEVSQHLSGIIFIDDNIIESEGYSCNIIMNPNALNTHSVAKDYLMELVAKGDEHSLFDDLQYDNY